MQLSRFSDGGFVLHKITPHTTVCRCSAWFDKTGRLLDAELIDKNDRQRQIKRHGPTWNELQRIGGAYSQRI